MLTQCDNLLAEVTEKWKNKLNENISKYQCQVAFRRLHKKTKCIYIKNISFNLSHYRIATNKVLKDMNMTESSACPYCNEDPEKVIHTFIECPNTIRI